LTVNSAV
jgi:hypothetical protein